MSTSEELPLPDPVPSTFAPAGLNAEKRYFDVRAAFEKLAVIKRLYRERFGRGVGEAIPPQRLAER